MSGVTGAATGVGAATVVCACVCGSEGACVRVQHDQDEYDTGNDCPYGQQRRRACMCARVIHAAQEHGVRAPTLITRPAGSCSAAAPERGGVAAAGACRRGAAPAAA